MASRIEVIGTDSLRRKLHGIGQHVEGAVRKQVLTTALAVQAGARERLTDQEAVDTGRLRNSIAIEELLQGLDAKIGTNVEYAEAIEFGLPPGTHPDVDSLTGWVRRKLGIADPDMAKSVAFLVARKITKSGTEAQPYLHPAAEEQRRDFARRMRNAVREALEDVARG